MKRKIIFLIAAMIILLLLMTSCDSGSGETADTSESHETAETTVSDESSSDNGETTQEDSEPAPLMPAFSKNGGYYDSDFSLELTVPDGSDRLSIRYTTDGSIPTAKSALYEKPISISDKVAVIRAACFDGSGKLSGFVATSTYIKATAPNVFTVSINAIDKELKKLTNNYNDNIEIPAHVEIIDPEGELVITQDAGLKVFGGSSRSLEQKSFKLIARKTEKLGKDYYYGTGSFKYKFFESRVVRSGEDAGKVLKKYDSLILRNGGNDSVLHSSVDPDYASLLRDNAANNLAAAFSENLDYANSTFAVVYLNGQYYGILDLKENMNEDYVKRVYGVDDKDVVIVKSELDTSRGSRFGGEWFFYESDSQKQITVFEKLCEKAAKHINSSNYDSTYADLCEKIDIDNFIDYIALNLYVCNTDWPHNNVKLWKYTGEKIDGIEITDGKWRFMSRDMDMAFGRYDSSSVLPELNNSYNVDTFYRILGNYYDYTKYYANEGETELYKDSLGIQGLFAFFMKNPEFRAKFEERCRTLASLGKDKEIITAQADSIRELIPDYLKRWKSAIPSSYKASTWEKAVTRMTEFTDKRPQQFLDYLDRAIQIINK